MKFAGKSKKFACRRSDTLRLPLKKDEDCGRMKDWRSSPSAGAEGASFLKKNESLRQKDSFFDSFYRGYPAVLCCWFMVHSEFSVFRIFRCFVFLREKEK